MLLCRIIYGHDYDIEASYRLVVVEYEVLCEVSYSDRSPTWMVGAGIMDC